MCVSVSVSAAPTNCNTQELAADTQNNQIFAQFLFELS